MDQSRRNFLKMAGLVITGLVLWGCRRTKASSPVPKSSPDISLWKAEVRQAMFRDVPLGDLVPVKIPGPLSRFPKEMNRFGMAIDLDLCNGCGECILACMLENNIPRVNSFEAEKGRFMHWIQMRKGVPVMCSHCGDAPCEKVCPTGAAVASPDGISAMVYARCIGSRYCGANCPSKTRKFNYTDAVTEGLAAKFNAEVPLRSRGVMEKCSLCLQRLQNDRLRAKTLGEEWRGMGVQSACAEACPQKAILFGNWLDSESPLVRGVYGRGIYTLKSIAGLNPSVVYLVGRS